MSDAGQVTADEGGKVGRWAGGQVTSGAVGFPSILTLSNSGAGSTAPQTLQTRPGTNQERSSAPAARAGALFFTTVLLFPWESLWRGKETI